MGQPEIQTRGLLILWVMMDGTRTPPPPEAVSVHSDDSDAPVAVLSELNELDPRFLLGASDCDAISAICVQSSSGASSHQH